VKIRWNPTQQRFPILKAKLVIDTFRGQIRLRAWPRKRGPPKSAAVRRQNAWFKAANLLAKQLPAQQQNLAIAMTLGTGLYPRDLLLRQMAGGIYHLITQDGREILPNRRFLETVVFQGAILELTSNLVLPAAVPVTVIWPLPVRDTNGFWNAGFPTRLTVPADVTVIELSVGSVATQVFTNEYRTDIIDQFAKVVARIQITTVFPMGSTASTGPMVVTPGDFFEVSLQHNSGATLQAASRCFFALKVLEAV